MKKIMTAALAAFLLAACNDNTSTVERVERGFGNFNLQAYDMRDGVRCYLYPNNGISCVKVSGGNAVQNEVTPK